MRVLIVEDEPLIAQRLGRFCGEILGEKLESIRVATVFSEASARLDEAPIDLLLLDLNLHGRDGMELLKASVAESFHTIIVSANTDQALRAFEFGVIDFVPKPFSKERLAQAFARVTERDGRASGGKVSLDQEARARRTRGDRPHRLSRGGRGVCGAGARRWQA